MRPARATSDGGAVIVEAALVLPVLFALVLGLVQFASVEFAQSQTTSAARDGARVGIIDYQQADVPGTPANDAVVAAVRARLTDLEGLTVTVQCLAPGGNPVTCSTIQSANGYIEVTASRPYDGFAILPSLAPSTSTGRSRMALVGAPVDVTVTTGSTSTIPPTSSTTPTTVAPSCQVTQPQVTVGSVITTNGPTKGQLTDNLTITFGVQNAAQCLNLAVTVFPAANGTNNPKLTAGVAVANQTVTATVLKDASKQWVPGNVSFTVGWTGGSSTYTFALT